MRKIITLFTLILSLGLLSLNSVFAQTEMLSGGNMELSTDWSISSLNSQVSATAVWNYTDDVPAMGSGGCLNVSASINGVDIQQSQFSIYQPLALSSDLAYDFDGAFKDISENLTQFWCEVYVGTEPMDGNDYNGDNGILLAQFNAWNGACNGLNVDGTFKDNGCHEGLFIPDTTGDYFFVIKIGQGDWGGNPQSFNILLDELSFKEISSKPLTDFGSNVTSGYVPLTVNFEDKSGFATSWAWNFGDGSTSTDQNPTHTYTAVGEYTVSLTATNSNGDSTITKENYILVKEVPDLPVDGVLVGGNMEDESKWNISYLNTPEGSEPTATWNYTDEIPGAGNGGCLYVSGAVNNLQSQYCIYQEVDLSSDKVYTLNGAVKDISEDLTNSWIEVFIGTKPVDGEDYGSGQWKIASFSTWDACSHANVDGTFELDGCYGGPIVPDTIGTYYFVMKIGTIDWESTDRAFDILIDQLSFVESNSKPFPAFSGDVLTGFDPLTVNFNDESKMADSWAWDFGDGETSSDQNPSHTFNGVGKYTISLTVTNELGDSTIVKTDYITVNEPTALPDGEKLYGGNMENPDFWTMTNLGSGSHPAATWNNTADTLAAGEGGNLHLDLTDNSNGSQYCIWQAVELKADSAYHFDAAFRDLTGVVDFWCEAFIGTVPPTDNDDYGADSIKIAYFNTWEGAGNMVNGTFSEDGITKNNPYQPEVDGTYYFVLKAGAATGKVYDILLDEVTLKERTPVVLPTADFFADVISGEVPLNVQFFNTSEDAVEYFWNFGDGTTSTEFEPSHTYNSKGLYSVMLVAISETATDTLLKEDLISVEGNSIFTNNSTSFEIYPNPAKDMLYFTMDSRVSGNVKVYNILGNLVHSQESTYGLNTISVSNFKSGIYFIKVTSADKEYTQRVVVK